MHGAPTALELHQVPTLYVKDAHGQLWYVRRVQGVYGQRVKGTFVPVSPQPNSSTVLTIFRIYNSPSRAKCYR